MSVTVWRGIPRILANTSSASLETKAQTLDQILRIVGQNPHIAVRSRANDHKPLTSFLATFRENDGARSRRYIETEAIELVEKVARATSRVVDTAVISVQALEWQPGEVLRPAHSG